MSKVVLLTGATGFVGRQILKALDKSKVKVRCVVRKKTESKIPTLANSIESIIFTNDLFLENENLRK